MPRFREEVVNVQVADLLSKYGLKANPETIKKTGRPDVIINMGGLKVVIEGRFGNRESLKEDVTERIKSGMADISLGIFYPDALREGIKNLQELRMKIKTSMYDGVICYFERSGLTLKEFQGLSLNNIIETINNIFHLYIKNDLVQDYVVKVGNSMEEIIEIASGTGLFFQSETLIKRLKQTLGIINAKEA